MNDAERLKALALIRAGADDDRVAQSVSITLLQVLELRAEAASQSRWPSRDGARRPGEQQPQ